MLLHYQICICLSSHSKSDMDWKLFLQNCIYIKLLIIMFIGMFDVQYWKSNNICNTWKIKKGKTKNLNVVYLLKRINGLCNFNFYFKITWPPYHHRKIKFLTPSKLEGGRGGAVHVMPCDSLWTLIIRWILKCRFCEFTGSFWGLPQKLVLKYCETLQ